VGELLTGALPAFDPALEDAYRAAREELARPRRAGKGGLLMMASLIAFALFQLGGGASLANLAVVTITLVIHEGGHWLGMKLFGYRDVGVFFIPLFGAATTGRRAGVAAWKQALVLLLGPLPGIVIGLGLLIATAIFPEPLVASLGKTMIAINAFNLVPLAGLDGGQLFQRVIFSRHRYLETGFLLLAGLTLLGLALAAQLWLLAIFAYFGLVTVRWRHRVARAAAELRRERGRVSADVHALDDEEARAVFFAAYHALFEQQRARPRNVSSAMEQVVDAAQPPPGLGASVLLLGGWALAILLSLVAAGIIGLAGHRGWHRYQDPAGAFSVELPGAPLPAVLTEQTPAGARLGHAITVHKDFVKRFSLERLELDAAPADAQAWLRARRDTLGRELGARLVAEQPATMTGAIAREYEFATARRHWRARLILTGKREIDQFASAPELDGDAEAERFFRSFALGRDAGATP
jgi:Zn-dependent protease